MNLHVTQRAPVKEREKIPSYSLNDIKERGKAIIYRVGDWLGGKKGQNCKVILWIGSNTEREE